MEKALGLIWKLQFPRKMFEIDNPQAAMKELFSEALSETCRERRLWLPPGVDAYLIYVATERCFDSVPDNIGKVVIEQHNNIPMDQLDRFHYLRNCGDFILYWKGFCGLIKNPFFQPLAQMYYEDSAKIGKKLNKPVTPILEAIAGKLPDYEPVIRETTIRMAA